jgi:hypothetical protein
MQRRRRAIISNISSYAAIFGFFIEARKIGALVDEAALGQYAEEIGFRLEFTRHGTPLFAAARCKGKGCFEQGRPKDRPNEVRALIDLPFLCLDFDPMM